MIDHLDELLGGNELARISSYLIKEQSGAFELRIYEFLNGPRRGQFAALPYCGYHSAKKFRIQADTHDEALRNCLLKIRGVPFERIFPQKDEGGPT